MILLIGKKIRVLVVDDSPLFRKVIARGLSLDKNIEIVDTAEDAFDARDKIIKYDPDVITCDIEMPKMDGLAFVKKLMSQYPKPVVMVSSLNNVVFDVMRAGAVDFVAKPDVKSPASIESFVRQLIDKIKAASRSKVVIHKDESPNEKFDYGVVTHEVISSDKIIAIGASTGGTETINNFIKQLPSTVPGILIVQHIPPKFSEMFADRLNRSSNLTVKEAKTGDYVEQGHVYVAPGDKHMRIVKVGDKYKIECYEGEKVSGHCPSVDVLFNSVAKTVGKKAVGILLTGMGADGAKGLLEIKKKGGRTIGQDEESSIVYGMPRVAYEIGAVEKQLHVSKMPAYLIDILKGK